MYSLNCKGRLLTWHHPVVMGIINITPDSFYAASRVQSEGVLLRQAEKMISEGAVILDLGGISTRPGALEISETEEVQRIVPAIEAISDRFPDVILSVDTYRYGVAEKALQAGASMLNDIGAGENEGLDELSVKLRVPYVCMHMKGNPANMQQLAVYNDVVAEVLDFFIRRKAEYKELGGNDLIIDPGFGFAKTIDQNFTLLKQMKVLSMLDLPVLVGLSRKATVYKTLQVTPEEALNGSTVMHTLALEQGAQILRVHDVKEAVEAVRLWTSYANA